MSITDRGARAEFEFDAFELVGVDFSCAPNRAKPIVAAHGRWRGGALEFERWSHCEDWLAFDRLLRRPGPWLGGFDLPFGLPRELVVALGWPTDWLGAMHCFCATERSRLRDRFKAFCAARPAGAKFAHRATDRPAGSSPSMKWVNPPVAWMMHAGIPRLLSAGVSLPGLHWRSGNRLAFEAYPGLVARAVTAHRSYKSDDRRLIADPNRRLARQAIVHALERGEVAQLAPLALGRRARDDALNDGRGDRLDALLCLAQAGWALQRPDFGLPPELDRLEGWIIGAGAIGTVESAGLDSTRDTIRRPDL
jgi:hypothetical protein